jgi:hypothetical protein
MESNNAANFLGFLKSLERKYPKKQLHIIADNLSIHKQKENYPYAFYSNIFFLVKSN